MIIARSFFLFASLGHTVTNKNGVAGISTKDSEGWSEKEKAAWNRKKKLRVKIAPETLTKMFISLLFKKRFLDHLSRFSMPPFYQHFHTFLLFLLTLLLSHRALNRALATMRRGIREASRKLIKPSAPCLYSIVSRCESCLAIDEKTITRTVLSALVRNNTVSAIVW